MLNAKREKQRQDRKLVKGTSLLSPTPATASPSAAERLPAAPVSPKPASAPPSPAPPASCAGDADPNPVLSGFEPLTQNAYHQLEPRFVKASTLIGRLMRAEDVWRARTAAARTRTVRTRPPRGQLATWCSGTTLAFEELFRALTPCATVCLLVCGSLCRACGLGSEVLSVARRCSDIFRMGKKRGFSRYDLLQ